ncbi:hypothetical protein WJX72_006849 [[Myrmecia] bisecta]|uniref:Phosphate transporter n=1 Tax=[Myrmecia] bisecta TaxID=41462 RepID=A0AAW1PB63_9CHLO
MVDGWAQYCWIVVVGGVYTSVVGFGIGAIDWGNNFAASVASRALSYRQAAVLGAIFEIIGAFVLGPRLRLSIRKGAADWQAFTGQPEALMYGLMCQATVTAAWLLLCSRMSLPISATQTIVVALGAMAFVLNKDSVNLVTRTSTFPYTGGILAECLSLIVSPFLGMLFAALFLLIIRNWILRSSNAFHKALWALPSLACLSVLISLLFLHEEIDRFRSLGPESLHVTIACAAGTVTAVVTAVVIVPWVRLKVLGPMLQGEKAHLNHALQDQDLWIGEVMDEEKDSLLQQGARRTRERILAILDKDIHKAGKEDPLVAAMQQNTEKFDVVAEDCFKALQVLLSCAMALGHGASNAINATCHFATMLHIYQTGSVEATVDQPLWMLAIAAVSIVLGGVLYGYNIMTVLGVKIARISPARGFAIQLCSVFVVVLASKLQLPISRTFTTVCATFAVGALEGRRNTNKRVMVKIISAWLLTLVVPALFTAVLVAQAVYSPSIHDPHVAVSSPSS